MRKRSYSILLSLIFVTFYSTGLAGEWKSGYVQSLVTDQLFRPTSIAVAPDGRIFVSEKSGTVKIIEEGVLLSTPFLSLDVDQYGERGLSSIVLDPDFDETGYVYVYYNVRDKNHNRLSRFTANGNAAIPGSETVLMDLDQLEANIHNGGAMRFSVDGKLFIATGDGGSYTASQDMSSTSGKMLRINPDGSIPTDNPFYGSTSGNARAIYALGFRNPFTFDIDPFSGRIFVNDVGNNEWEEVNEVVAGGNYGWPTIEGPRTNQSPPTNYQDPLFAYDHDAGCGVVGGLAFNYLNTNYPAEIQNHYLFIDYCEGIISMLHMPTDLVVDTLAKGLEKVTNITIDEETGTILFVEEGKGSLWRVQYIGTGAPFIAQPVKSVLVPVGEDVEFFCNAIAADTIQYQWSRNGTDINGEVNSTLQLSNVQLADSGDVFQCRAFNSLGSDTSTVAVLGVTSNQRPVITITSPDSTIKYKAGDKIVFDGFAVDPETGPVPVADLEWYVGFHHDNHVHPFLPLTAGTDTGSFFVPIVGETDTNVWYRLHLQTADSLGMEGEAYVDVHPEIAKFELKTSPSGLNVFHNGAFTPTPADLYGVVGMQRTVLAPQYSFRNDSLFKFVEWDVQSAQILEFLIPGNDTSFTATYEYLGEYVLGNGDGLYNEVWQNTALVCQPTHTQIDSTVDFDAGTGNLFHLTDYTKILEIGIDNFGLRWTGDLLAPSTGSYTFFFDYDDKMRFYLNGVLLIDKFKKVGTRSDSISINLVAGQRYPIQVDYGEASGNAYMKMRWISPWFEKSTIPKRQLYSTSNNPDLFVRTEPNICLYPVPFDNELNITFQTDPDSTEREVQLQVVNTFGDFLHDGTYSVDPHNPIKVNTDAVPKGAVIFVRIKLNGRFETAKAVKMSE